MWSEGPALSRARIGLDYWPATTHAPGIGRYARELVRALVLPALQGTPPREEPPKGSRSVVFGGSNEGTAVRVKRRLLPTGSPV